MRYWNLAVMIPGVGWSLEFGDYDQMTVRYEAQEYRDNGDRVIVFSSGDKQHEIEVALRKAIAKRG